MVLIWSETRMWQYRAHDHRKDAPHIKISDNRRPIWMILWGCIQLTLKIFIVIFSTSDLELKILKNKLKHFQIDSKSFQIRLCKLEI